MNANAKLVYLIDDSPIIVTRLRSILQEVEGLGEIRSAESHDSAVVLLAERQPDIVVLDIHLSNRTGIELLQYIHDRYPAVRVIMLSNQSTPRYRALCLELGAAHFVDKSTEFGQMRRIVADYCQDR